jgi:hypothetical protein
MDHRPMRASASGYLATNALNQRLAGQDAVRVEETRTG